MYCWVPHWSSQSCLIFSHTTTDYWQDDTRSYFLRSFYRIICSWLRVFAHSIKTFRFLSMFDTKTIISNLLSKYETVTFFIIIIRCILEFEIETISLVLYSLIQQPIIDKMIPGVTFFDCFIGLFAYDWESLLIQ